MTITASPQLDAAEAAGRTLVFMFPGQSSRYPEMIEKVISTDRESVALVRRASEILCRNLAAHYRAENAAMFDHNRDVQIGVFLANHLHLCALERLGIRSSWSLGLSLGEYNHLVHIGALSFEEALRLVDRRGRLYDNGPPGVMVSVFPVESEIVTRVIEKLRLTERVFIGLYNSPRQQVLSGERCAVKQVVAALERDMLLEVVELEPRIPMHAPLFEPVAAKMSVALARTILRQPFLAYVPNQRGIVMTAVSPDEIRSCLTRHVCEPVRWRASVDAVTGSIRCACFVEVGPKNVLYNLFGRGWMPGLRASTDRSGQWQDHLRSLAADLRNAA
jgi:[acyl-carrier-protein] S-malonyltransferase